MSMLLDLRVWMISSWLASPNCLVRFSDTLWRAKPSRRNEASGSVSGLRELEEERRRTRRRRRKRRRERDREEAEKWACDLL